MLTLSRRTTILAFVVAVIVVASGAAISWGVVKSSSFARSASERQSSIHLAQKAEVASSCQLVGTKPDPACALPIVRQGRKSARAEAELAAQQQSAAWTQLMAIVAVVGTALSFLGVFLVWTTFDETRRSNAIAREALDGQLRPWIDFEVDLGHVAYVSGSIKASIAIRFRHHGAAPALYLSYIADLFVEDMPSERALNLLPSLFTEEWNNYTNKTVFPGEKWAKNCVTELENVQPGPTKITLVVGVRYKSPYSAKFKMTSRIYDLFVAERYEEPILLQGNHGLERVRLLQRDGLSDFAS